MARIETKVRYFWINWRTGEFDGTSNEAVALQIIKANKPNVEITKITETRERINL